MSYQIYTAWKIPLGLLNEAIQTLEAKELELKFIKYKLQLVNLDQRYKGNASQKDLFAEFLRRAREASINGEWSAYYFDCSLSIYIQGSASYLTPFNIDTNLVDLPDYLEDFHYQNKTDNCLSPQEDEYRRQVWDELFKLPCLGYDIIQVKNRWCNKMLEFERRYNQEKLQGK